MNSFQEKVAAAILDIPLEDINDMGAVPVGPRMRAFQAAARVEAALAQQPQCGKPAGELICNNTPGHKGKCGWTILREEKAK